MNAARWLFPAAGLVTGLAAGWVLFPALLYRTEAQPVQFSHAIHTSEAVGMTCKDCHVLGDDGRFAGVPALQQCAGCHAEPVGSTEEERRFVEEYVKQGREIPWRSYARQPDNAYFPHAAHVTVAGIACERCHGDHGSSTALRPASENRISGYGVDRWGMSPARWGMTADVMKMDECIACHRAEKHERACLDCHK